MGIVDWHYMKYHKKLDAVVDISWHDGGDYLIRIAVVDDEKPFRERIGRFLEHYLSGKEECHIRYFDSGMKVVELEAELQGYDIFFLDISMEGVDGIEAAKEIRKYSDEAYIVFVTAYIDYSLEGYKVDAIRYVLKDSDSLEGSLEECMNAIMKKRKFVRPSRLFRFNECEKEIFIENIRYISSQLHKLEFHIGGGSTEVYTMYETLNNMEQELSEYGTFVRIHQSYLVNLRYIKRVRNYRVILSNDEELNVPRTRYSAVKTAYIKYKREI